MNFSTTMKPTIATLVITCFVLHLSSAAPSTAPQSHGAFSGGSGSSYTRPMPRAPASRPANHPPAPQPTVIQPLHQVHHHNQHNQQPSRSIPHAARLPSRQSHQHQTPVSQYQAPAVCQISHELVGQARCLGAQDEHLIKTAKKEFKATLVETSSELRDLLSSYLDEFKSLSLGLVLIARNDTINKLRQFSAPQAGRHQLESVQLATRHLFDSMFAQLASYAHLQSTSSDPLVDLNSLFQAHATTRQRSMFSPVDLSQELAAYFRRLHLIHLKRGLEEAARVGALNIIGEPQQQQPQQSVELDIECLDNNLAGQAQVETLMLELLQTSSTQAEPADQVASLKMEQARVSLAVHQSVEFARTLLGALHLADKMFANLTQRADEWLLSNSCGSALARMSSCQECHVSVAQAPCQDFCLNVARGCMNDLFELNRFWAEHVNSLARLKTNMIQSNNIENVMSNLDLKLLGFVERLQRLGSQQAPRQQQTTTNNSNSSTNSHLLPTAVELIKRCPRNLATTSSATSSWLGEWFHPSQRLAAAAAAASGRHAGKVLPATQQRPDESKMSEAALKARQSPALSLFNRLDSLTHQLLTTRDFFAQWPQQMCQRIRAKAIGNQQQQQSPQASLTQEPNSIGLRRANSSANTECWNGRDFSGYTKPLAEFGLPLSAAHPEVPVQQAQPIGPLVRDLVVRLKEIGGQLARRSARSPYNPIELMAMSKLSAPGGKTSSEESPLAEARVSEGAAATLDQPAVIIERREQLTAAALKLAAANAAELASQQQQQQQADGSETANKPYRSSTQVSSLPPDEDLEAPDGEAAESEGDGEPDDFNRMASDAAEEEEEDENLDGPNPECKTEDCSDILRPNDSSSDNNNNNNNNVPQDPELPDRVYTTYQPAQANREPVYVDPITRYPSAPNERPDSNQMISVVEPSVRWPQPPSYYTERAPAPSAPGQVQLSGLQIFLLLSAPMALTCLLLWHFYRAFTQRSI